MLEDMFRERLGSGGAQVGQKNTASKGITSTQAAIELVNKLSSLNLINEVNTEADGEGAKKSKKQKMQQVNNEA